MNSKSSFNKWLSFLQLKKTYHFFGKKVTTCLVISIFTGFCLFFIELLFAFSIQAFLGVLGVADIKNLSIPNWYPHEQLLHVLLVLTLIATIRGGLLWGQEVLRGSANSEFNYYQRKRLVDFIFSSQTASSSYMTTLFNERITQSSNAVMLLQISFVQITVCLSLCITLFYVSPLITILLLSLFFTLAFPLYTANKRIKKAGDNIASEWVKINNRLLMSIKNLLLLRIYGIEKTEGEIVQKNLSFYLINSISFFKYSGIITAFPQVVGILLICLMTYFIKSIYQLNPGYLLSYFYLFIRLLQNISNLAGGLIRITFLWPQLTELAAWWSNHSLDGFNVKKHQTTLSKKNNLLISKPIGWSCSDISFRFSDIDPYIFDNFDCEISPGSTVVITGTSGAGKSTLINLLLGELIPLSGRIEVITDNKAWPLKEVKNNILKNIGYVGPESFIIEGTIYDNVVYGLIDVPTKEELEINIKKAECQFIYQLPNKLNHMLTEQGQGLSAGQKQRLSLLKALLRKPKALILDEATSNLDIETEDKLIETFLKLKGQMTIIAVTHRKGLLRIADKVFSLNTQSQVC